MTDWLDPYRSTGLRPYVATSRMQLGAIDLAPMGPEPLVYCLEESAAQVFHRAYLTANALAFGARDLKMPGWVYIDCVLMQTAVVGFAAPREAISARLAEELKAELGEAVESLDWVPVSGQTASAGVDGRSLVGFSLFSLKNLWPELPSLGFPTKALALEVYKAATFDRFIGITQYDNKALRLHGRFGPKLEIVAAKVPLHAQGERSLIYGMKIDFDPADPDAHLRERGEPPFWLNANDQAAIDRIAEGLEAGRRYSILPPFQVQDGSQIRLPILEE